MIRNTRTSVHWLQVELFTAVTHSLVLTPLAFAGQYAVLILTGRAHDARTVIFDGGVDASTWAVCVGVGVVAFVGLGCSTKGFQLEEAPRGAIVMYLEIPFMYAAQAWVFGVRPSATEIIGVSLVLLACLVSATEPAAATPRAPRTKEGGAAA